MDLNISRVYLFCSNRNAYFSFSGFLTSRNVMIYWNFMMSRVIDGIQNANFSSLFEAPEPVLQIKWNNR